MFDDTILTLSTFLFFNIFSSTIRKKKYQEMSNLNFILYLVVVVSRKLLPIAKAKIAEKNFFCREPSEDVAIRLKL